MKAKKLNGIMNTKYVFSKNNQVTLKNNIDKEWYPINFQWISIIKLNQNMNQ